MTEQTQEQIQRKILLVDDTKILRHLLVAIFSKHQFTIVEAEHGQDALEKIELDRPDVVLCDLMMPVMSGREFIRAFRERQEFSKIPVVVLSAEDCDLSMDELLELGADGVIQKTTPPSELVKLVRGFLSNV